ncbi:hypothetical protein ACXJY3_18415 [Morganella morganii]|uniref:hypothetical protein n=1 Tax=unclassified Morganella (in: enterobacteria) TaxID=2676694 RepID=UPI0029436569|nr:MULTISPECIES: hypothetical protein [unclassified Morganella (in: enterobacteria)]
MKISNAFKWSSLSIIFLTIGWVLINGDKALENINSFRQWHGSSPELTGKWTNSTEGWVDERKWHGDKYPFMEIELTVENYEAEGTISTKKIKEILPFDFVLFRGKKSYFSNTIDGVAFDYILGKEVILGTISLSLNDDGELIVIDSERAPSIFPKKTILWKISDQAFDSQNSKSEHKDESNQK